MQHVLDEELELIEQHGQSLRGVASAWRVHSHGLRMCKHMEKLRIVCLLPRTCCHVLTRRGAWSATSYYYQLRPYLLWRLVLDFVHTEEVESVQHEIANLVGRWRGEGRGEGRGDGMAGR